MELKEKLYICQYDNGKLVLLTRAEVDEEMNEADNDDRELEFGVLGTVDPNKLAEGVNPYLMVAKLGTANFYSVEIAENPEKAAEQVLSKKRFAKAKIASSRDISELIKSYYE